MPQPKKGILDAIAKTAAKGAAKKVAKKEKKAAAKKTVERINERYKEVAAAKKEAAKTLKNAGKAGSPLSEKVVVGSKTRKKMAEGNFGKKVKKGPAATQKSTSTGNVKKRPGSNPFIGL
jgi:hypothetical protein